MKTTVLEDKLFKMLKDNLADLWQDDLISEAGKSLRNSNPCWKGYHPVGTKKKGGKTVPNCVPSESVAEGSEEYCDACDRVITKKPHVCPGSQGVAESDDKYIELSKKIQDLAQAGKEGEANKLRYELNRLLMLDRDKKRRKERGVAENVVVPPVVPVKSRSQGSVSPEQQKDIDRDVKLLNKYRSKGMSAGSAADRLAKFKHKHMEEQGVAEDWNKVNHHDKTNGLSQKAVNAYRRENPGSKLKTAVTTKPSKLKAGSKAAKRRKSFCARMSGNKGPMKKPNGKPTPKALALRRWHCESLEELLVTARQHIYEAEGEPEGLKHLTPHLAKDILDQIETEGVHAIVKSIEWGDGGAKELVDIIKRELKKVAND